MSIITLLESNYQCVSRKRQKIIATKAIKNDIQSYNRAERMEILLFHKPFHFFCEDLGKVKGSKFHFLFTIANHLQITVLSPKK